MYSFYFAFSLVTLISFHSGIMQVQGEVSKNLSSITWDHAVNSQQLLTEALKTDVDMIEADIVFGYLINDTTRTLQPIMGHPPAEEGDITLKSFLTQILNFNKDSGKQKGVKLDFKSTGVFQNSMPILIEMWSMMSYPVWINADIYAGPLNNTLTLPVDAKVFFNGTNSFPNATLSTGWTTRWGNNFTEGIYTTEQVNEMVTGIRESGTKNPITFPVRAGIAAQSIDTLDILYKSLNNTNLITFTIWSSVNDFVDIPKLRKMIFHFGLDKVYVDVPKEVSDQLHLDDKSSSSSLNSIYMLGLMLIVGILMMLF